jgi:hypothetical protein
VPVVELLAEILQVRAPQARGDVPGQGAEARAGRPAEQQPRAEASDPRPSIMRRSNQPRAGGGSSPRMTWKPAVRLDLAMSGAHLVQPAQRHQFQPKRQDAAEHVVQGSLVKITSEQGMAVGVFDLEVCECLAAQLAQTTENSDPVAMRAHRSSRY